MSKYNFFRIYLLCLGLLKIQTSFQRAHFFLISVSNSYIIFYSAIKENLSATKENVSRYNHLPPIKIHSNLFAPRIKTLNYKVKGRENYLKIS